VAVSGRSRGATAAGHGWDDHDWMGDDWMAFTRSTRNYGPGDSDSRQLTENATEKRKSTAGARRARARIAPLLELEDDWMGPGDDWMGR
jgi:hypothetical protein